jgi:hypothetical protein
MFLRGAPYIRCTELCNKKVVKIRRGAPVRIKSSCTGNISPISGHLTEGIFLLGSGSA